jgi:acetyltransferase-like isoleucine patch superfamily enzyme
MPILIYKNTRIVSVPTAIVLNIDDPIRVGMIRIGMRLTDLIDAKKVTLLNVRGKLIFNGTCYMGSGSRILISESGRLTIGTRFNVTGNLHICCEREINIGNDCMFAWNVTLLDTDYHPIRNSDGIICNKPENPLNVGNHVWLGFNSAILKGVNIADGCIISAGSVVRHNLDIPNTIYGMKEDVSPLKSNIGWSKDVFLSTDYNL